MKRRQFTSPSSLDLAGGIPQPGTPSSSRPGSPFIFNPTRWFRNKPKSEQPEPETSSRPSPPSPRRPNISQPTDPRPLLEVPRPHQLPNSRYVYVHSTEALRSHFIFSSARIQTCQVPRRRALTKAKAGLIPPAILRPSRVGVAQLTI